MRKNILCPYCKSDIKGNHPKKVFKTTISTSFSNALENGEIEHTVNLSNCHNCGIALSSSDSDHLLLGFLNPKIKNKEPVGHQEKIAEIISEKISSYYIKTRIYSYKDNLLEKEISKYLKNIEDRGYQQVKQKESNIWICTRYLEHINDSDYLNKIIDNIEIGDTFILEILDYQQLVDRKDYSFIWDERVSYPTGDFIKKYFAFNGFICMKEIKNQENEEPFLIYLLKKKFSISTKISINKYLKSKEIDIIRIDKNIIKLAKKIAASYKSISLYGAGHKTLMAANYLKRVDNTLRIEIYDGSSDKIGSSWRNYKIKDIENADFFESELHLFGFTGKFAEKYINRIRKENTSAKIKNISILFKE